MKKIKQDINFLEFPLYVLNSRSKKNKVVIETDKGIYTYFSSTNDIPDSKDALILYYLLFISQKQRKRNFEITKYNIAKALNFSTSKNEYKRIEKSLSNWLKVSVEFEGTFYDGKSYLKKGFHILEYSIDKDTKKIKINFNKNFINIIEDSKFFKYVNLNHLIALKRPLSRRLYEYLLKQFLKESVFKINIIKLAEKLTISEKYPSQIIKKLNPALKEINNYIKEYSLKFHTYKNNDNKTIAVFERTNLFEVNESSNFILSENILKHVPEKYRTDSILKLLEIYTKKYNESYVISNFKYSLNHSKDNLIQYLKLSLKDDYAKIDRELSEKRRLLEERERQFQIEKQKKDEEEKQQILKEQKETEEKILYLRNINEYKKYKEIAHKKEKVLYPNFSPMKFEHYENSKIIEHYEKDNGIIKL